MNGMNVIWLISNTKHLNRNKSKLFFVFLKENLRTAVVLKILQQKKEVEGQKLPQRETDGKTGSLNRMRSKLVAE